MTSKCLLVSQWPITAPPRALCQGWLFQGPTHDKNTEHSKYLPHSRIHCTSFMVLQHKGRHNFTIVSKPAHGPQGHPSNVTNSLLVLYWACCILNTLRRQAIAHESLHKQLELRGVRDRAGCARRMERRHRVLGIPAQRLVQVCCNMHRARRHTG